MKHTLASAFLLGLVSMTSACRLLSDAVACVDDVVCLPGEACIDGVCAPAVALEDAGVRDAGDVDAGVEDAGDAGVEDAGDAGVEDAGEPDAGDVDAGAGEGEGEGEGEEPCPALDGVAGTLAPSGSCFYVLRAFDNLNFTEAEDTCASVGAHLAVPLGEGEQATVATLLPPGDKAVLGLRDFVTVGAANANRFSPVSFEVIVGSLAGFFNAGQPADQPLDMEQVEIVENCIESDANGNWNDIACGGRRDGALCELAACGNGIRDGIDEECDGEPGCVDCIATTCPHPAATTVILVAAPEGSKCLVRLDDTFTTGLTMPNARTACTNRTGPGARLALPTGDATNAALRGLGQKLVRIDVSDEVTDGTFVTSTGAALGFEKFANNQPTNTVDVADCVVARTFSPGAWISDLCDVRRGVVCEIDPAP